MENAVATQKQKREKVWTKEKFREYHRERWRRVNGVTPENHRVDEEGNRIYGSKYKTIEEYLNARRELQKARKPPVPKTECSLCGGLHYDTDASKARHDKNRRHKLALEVASRLCVNTA